MVRAGTCLLFYRFGFRQGLGARGHAGEGAFSLPLGGDFGQGMLGLDTAMGRMVMGFGWLDGNCDRER